MAKPSWISYTPEGGKGNGTVQVTTAKHTGRKQRECVLQIRTTTINGYATQITKDVTVIQAGNSIGLRTLNETGEYVIGANITRLTIEGVTNGYSLRYTVIDTNDLKISLDGYYTAEGVQIQNGEPAINGTKYLGEDYEYEFSLGVNIPDAIVFEEKSSIIEIKALDEDGNTRYTITIRIRQHGDDVTLEVQPANIEFDANGGTKSISITSNTDWEFINGN